MPDFAIREGREALVHQLIRYHVVRNLPSRVRDLAKQKCSCHLPVRVFVHQCIVLEHVYTYIHTYVT